jgi:hypothetical protein
MLTLELILLDVPCPRCRLHNAAFFRQVTRQDVIICRGCKASISLRDYLGKSKVAGAQIRKAVWELEDSLRQLDITMEL